MTRIALVSESPMARGIYLGQIGLPSNYMEDYSRMGFMVDRFEDALAVLRTQSIEVDEQKAGAAILIDAPAKIVEIRDLLLAHNINCTYSDIADTLYQA